MAKRAARAIGALTTILSVLVLMVLEMTPESIISTVSTWIRDYGWTPPKWLDPANAPLAVLWGVRGIAFIFVAIFAWAIFPLFRRVPVSVIKVYFKRDPRPGTDYKLKMVIIFKNMMSVPIEVFRPDWLANGAIQVQSQIPFGYRYRLSDGISDISANKWQGESDKVFPPPERVFDLWVGINERHQEDELCRLHDDEKLGTLVLPVKVGRKFRKVRISI